MFDQDDVTFAEIVRPHCEQTRASCRPGDVKLIINDTTEVDFGYSRRATGLGPTGNGFGRGFFLHSALMVNAADGRIDGLAGRRCFAANPNRNAARRRTRGAAGDEQALEELEPLW